jgi:hypothetical protein
VRPLLPCLPACLPWVAPTRDWLDSRLGRTSGKARRSVRWSGTTRSAATWHARAKPSPTASLLSTFLCHATRHLPTAQRGSRRSARGGTSVWEAADNASGGVEVPGASRVEVYYSRITAVYSTEKRPVLEVERAPRLPRHRPPGTGPDFWCSSQPSLDARAPRLSCHSHRSIISQAPTALATATGGRAHVRLSALRSQSSRIMPAARPSGAGLQENILMRTAHDTHETTVQRRGGEIPTNSQASRQPPRASVGAVATRGSALAHVGRRHSTLRCPGRFASDRAPRASRARSTSPNVSGHDRSRCHHPHRHGARAERPCDSLLSLYWKGPRLSGFTRAAAHMRP